MIYRHSPGMFCSDELLALHHLERETVIIQRSAGCSLSDTLCGSCDTIMCSMVMDGLTDVSVATCMLSNT